MSARPSPSSSLSARDLTALRDIEPAVAIGQAQTLVQSAGEAVKLQIGGRVGKGIFNEVHVAAGVQAANLPSGRFSNAPASNVTSGGMGIATCR